MTDRFIPLRVKVVDGYVHIVFDVEEKRIVKTCDRLHSERLEWTECDVAKEWTLMSGGER